MAKVINKQSDKISIITRTDRGGLEKTISSLKKITNRFPAEVIIISEIGKSKQKLPKNYKIVNKGKKSTQPTSFNSVLSTLKSKNHLLIFSKEVRILQKHINRMINELEKNKNLIVVGFKLKTKGLKDNNGISFQIPWNTCCMWNKAFINHSFKFDKICEENTLGSLSVKVDGVEMQTQYEGMEDGLLIARLLSKNPNLKYKLIKKPTLV